LLPHVHRALPPRRPRPAGVLARDGAPPLPQRRHGGGLPVLLLGAGGVLGVGADDLDPRQARDRGHRPGRRGGAGDGERPPLPGHVPPDDGLPPGRPPRAQDRRRAVAAVRGGGAAGGVRDALHRDAGGAEPARYLRLPRVPAVVLRMAAGAGPPARCRGGLARGGRCWLRPRLTPRRPMYDDLAGSGDLLREQAPPDDAGAIRFRRERDLGDVVNVTFRFLRDNAAELGRGLLVIVGPVALVAAMVSAWAQLQMEAAVQGAFDPADSMSPFGDEGYVTGLILTVLAVVAMQLLIQAVVLGYVERYRRGAAGTITPAVLWEATKEAFRPVMS